MRSLCLASIPLLFAACENVRHWQEMTTDPMPVGQVFEGIVLVASGDGLTADATETDRGNGVWQSRWRGFIMPLTRHPGRYRLRVEVLLDEGSAATGWPLRFAVDREKVDDLRRSIEPREEDWSAAGQDTEKEALIGDRLARRLAPKGRAARSGT
jgi:hypothetical protein